MAPPKQTKKNEAHTSEPLQPPPQLELLFKPVPDNAVQQILSKLFELAKDGNTSAAKLFMDLLKIKSDDTPAALTAEDALKLLQDHLQSQKTKN